MFNASDSMNLALLLPYVWFGNYSQRVLESFQNAYMGSYMNPALNTYENAVSITCKKWALLGSLCVAIKFDLGLTN